MVLIPLHDAGCVWAIALPATKAKPHPAMAAISTFLMVFMVLPLARTFDWRTQSSNCAARLILR
jgi:hypothetical protein